MNFACEQKKQAPNIIYILADDLGYGDLSFTGQQKFQTPNIDALAKDGMFFTQHYAGSTVCAPSRSALMTGQHTGHTFIRGNKEAPIEGQYPMDSAVVTVAEYLKMAGYTTGIYGKWGLGSPFSEGDPLNQGFDQFYGYNCQRLAHNYYPYHLWDNQTKEVLTANQDSLKGDYAPELIHEKALTFIEENKDQPFFLYYASLIPHAELFAPERYMEMFRGKLLPENEFKGQDDGPNYKNGGYGSQDESHAAFAAMIYLLDQQVGEIRKKVEELGIADNTLIIFTSDNGPHKEGGADPNYFDSNGLFTGFKRDLNEGGVRVPMIAFWPETIKANSTSDHASAFWDFLPTVSELIGTEPPSDIDGISYLPTLLGKEQPKHKFLYWEFHERGGKQAVRMGDWKGIRLKMAKDQSAPIALYDLAADPSEENDLASQYPDIVAQIDQIMSEQHATSDVFRFEYEKDTTALETIKPGL
jgi:arylsulfatase A